MLAAVSILPTVASAGITLSPFYTFDTATLAPGGGLFLNTDGLSVAALLQDSAGNLYGAASSGGSGGSGTIFRLTPGGAFSLLHSFAAAPGFPTSEVNTDGVMPSALVLDGSENLYGTTRYGGANGTGTVFSLSGGAFTTLHVFGTTSGMNQNSDGANPNALLLGSDGNLYGVAGSGGANGAGVVFRISPAEQFTVLYAFGSYDPISDVNDDGVDPTALIEGADGNFYGTTAGGGSNGTGTVFSLTPQGALQTLHTFATCQYCLDQGTVLGLSRYVNADGVFPASLMFASDGSLYGTTPFGGSGGGGVVFRLGTDNSFTILHPFGADGSTIASAVVESAGGTLFGTYSVYPTVVGQSNAGIYSLTTAGDFLVEYTEQYNSPSNPTLTFGPLLPVAADPSNELYVGTLRGDTPGISIAALASPATASAAGGGGGAMTPWMLILLGSTVVLRIGVRASQRLTATRRGDPTAASGPAHRRSRPRARGACA